jgi:hypothetical protein
MMQQAIAALIHDQMSEPLKHVLDLFAVGALVATLAQWLPAATAALVFVWTILRIVESWQAIKLNAKKLRGEE